MSEECRTALGRAWSAYLELLFEQKLADGTPLLQFVLERNPDLRRRLVSAMEVRRT